jgi:hypothetical protein
MANIFNIYSGKIQLSRICEPSRADDMAKCDALGTTNFSSSVTKNGAAVVGRWSDDNGYNDTLIVVKVDG